MPCKMQGCVGKNMSEDRGFLFVKMPVILNEKDRHQGKG